MPYKSSPKTGQFLPKTGQLLHGGPRMSASLSQIFFNHIRDEYAGRKHADEELARRAGVSPGTSRNWRRGICSAQTDTIGELARNDAAFKAKLIAWLEDRS